jgi:HAD superfamily hydrolase (TIGR01509 family)
MSKPMAVAFDLDGLMFNTESLYEDVGAVLVRRRGKSMSRDLLNQMMGRPSAVALQIMIDWYELDDSVDSLQAETDEIFEKILPSRLQPMPGLAGLLTALESANIAKAITTSSRRRFVDRVLELSGLEDRFDFILSAEDVRQGKPHPEIYLSAASRFGLTTQRMAVLEDSQNGIRAAVTSGALAIAVPGEHSRHHDFSGASLVADSLADDRVYAAIGIERVV